jgi:dipeptidyl-peptidase-4
VLHIADAMHPERPADAWPYPRPGHPNAEVRLGIVSRAGGATVWVDWDRGREPYLAAVNWRPAGPLTILVLNRAQTEQRLLSVDPQTGATRELVSEQDAAWVNIPRRVPHWLAHGEGFLWVSERTGERRLELRSPEGKPVRWLTEPGFGLRVIDGVDESTGTIFVTASPDQTQQQIWRLPLAGGRAEQLSSGAGMHTSVMSLDGSGAVWTEALLSGERRWTLHGRGGRETGTLHSVAEHPGFMPRLEFATLGPLGFNAAIVRPRSFVAGQRYPVLVNVYGGPGVQFVWKAPWQYLLDQWVADHGFIVLRIEGRGNPGRDRAWERPIKGNLVDVPLADQVAGLQAAGARYPEMDLSRVGIWGWSFGGYLSAMAAMRRPDIYKAAVAGAPVCAWEDYDTTYTERYLGLPAENPGGYHDSSVLTYCPNLKVPLLVVHGTSDDNVYFLHSLKMTDALFRAERPYDFLVLPGFTHHVADPAMQRSLQERILDFFTRHVRS